LALFFGTETLTYAGFCAKSATTVFFSLFGITIEKPGAIRGIAGICILFSLEESVVEEPCKFVLKFISTWLIVEIFELKPFASVDHHGYSQGPR
jgi:hypothetical protein